MVGTRTTTLLILVWALVFLVWSVDSKHVLDDANFITGEHPATKWGSKCDAYSIKHIRPMLKVTQLFPTRTSTIGTAKYHQNVMTVPNRNHKIPHGLPTEIFLKIPTALKCAIYGCVQCALTMKIA
jgi:hypothetical protein